MPLDAVCLRGVVQELKPQLENLRLEKIQQPARDLVLLTFRGNRKLLLCAGASQARIHLTDLQRENPAAPPMFCMLLRKHLSGGSLVSMEQPGLERAVILTFRVLDELGVSGQRQLVLECMGRRSNLVLLDGEGRILDCLRRVDFEMSPQRQVLPGLFYRLPPAVEKADPLAVEPEELEAIIAGSNPEKTGDALLLDAFFGLSPLVCREIASRAWGDSDARLLTAGPDASKRLQDAFLSWQSDVKENRFTPTILLRDGAMADFTYLPISQYGATVAQQTADTFSALLDTYFETREQQERVRQRGQDLLRCATTARDRVARKLAMQEKELAETERREELRLRGELITANLYRMERGQRVLQAENYYEEGCPTVEVPLDPLLTPQQNAAKYFKRYNKAKTAETILTQQIAKGREELAYLSSILDELSRAELEQDFRDARMELQAAGYLKGTGGKKEQRPKPAKPREFRSSAGLRILVGRSNSQNDRLTREADKRDIWLHTQKIHGSHVILCTEGAPADQQSLTEAAMLAAWFSQGRGGSQIAVDYTAVKNVKKPAGARPGMVVYDPYQTAYVTPDEALVKALAVK